MVPNPLAVPSLNNRLYIIHGKYNKHLFSAAIYDIRYSANAADFNDPKLWDTLKAITESDVVVGDLKPVEAGQNVTLNIKKSLFGYSDVYFFAIKASDDVGLESEMSTVERLLVDIYPPDAVRNLDAVILDSRVNISFTATGDDFDKGTG